MTLAAPTHADHDVDSMIGGKVRARVMIAAVLRGLGLVTGAG